MTGDAVVLVLCTANVCRSPAVAAVLAAALGRDVEVISAGSQTDPGAPACPIARQWAVHGLPDDRAALVDGRLARHHAVPLDRDAVRRADLILTMSRAHRSAVVAIAPSAQARTFPLRAVARLTSPLSGVSVPERVRELAVELDAARASDRMGRAPVSDESDAVPDAHLDRGVDHPQSFAVLGPAVHSVLDRLLG